MAIFFSTASGNLSASTWNRSEESALIGYAGTYYNSLSSTRYQNLTFANNCNLLGVVIFLGTQSGATDKSVVVELEQNTGSWVSVASKTLIYTDIFSLTTLTTVANGQLLPTLFTFATPIAVTTAGSTWRLKITQTGGTTGSWYLGYQDSGLTIVGRICVNDFATGKPSTTDCAVITKGHTITIDENWSLGNSEGVTNYPFSMIISEGGKVQNESIPSGAYTLTCSGFISTAGTGEFALGATTAVPLANPFNIVFNGPGTGKYFGFLNHLVGVNYYGHGGYVRLYGTTDAVKMSRLSVDASSGQAVLSVDDTVEGNWQIGDSVDVLGANSTSALQAGAEHKIIQSVSGSDVTLTTNLTYIHLENHYVVHRSSAHYSIVITYNTGSGGTGVFTHTGGATLYVGGVFIKNNTAASTIVGYTNDYLVNNTYPADSFGKTFNDCFFSNLYFNNNYVIAITVSDVIAWCNNLSFMINLNTRNVVVSNCVIYDLNLQGLNLQNVGNCTVDGCVFDAGISTMVGGIYGNSNITLTNCTFNGAQSVFRIDSALGWNVSGCTITTVRDSVFFISGGCSDIVFTDCTYNGALFTTNGETRNQMIINGGSGLSHPLNSEILQLISGSLISVHSFGEIDGNQHYNYHYAGIIASVGDGLVDTTAHTNGSGKFALRFEPLSSTNNLDWEFDIPTGNIQGMTMTVAVWVKINNASYYAGTHQKPRLEIDSDNGTVSYAEAVAGTGWQLLSVTFVPSTSYGQVTVTVSGRTDAVGSNAYFYVDDFAVLYPAGYKLDLGGLDLWANALPVVPPIATVLSANDVWGALDTISYGANTMGDRMRTLLSTFDPDVDVVEGTITVTQALRVLLALLAGEASGGGSTDIRFRDQADTKDRVRMLVDGNGNRSSVTLDLS